MGLGALTTTLGSVDAATLAYLGFLSASLPVAYFLVEFAASQAPRASRAWTTLRVLFGVIALVGALVFILAPGLLFVGVIRQTFGLLPVQGPLFVPLVAGPQFAAFGLALWSLHRAAHDAATPRIAERTALLLAGLGLYVGFAAGNNLAFFVGASTSFPSTRTLQFVGIFAALAAVALLVAASHLRRGFATREPTQRKHHLLAGAAIGGPFAWGLFEAALALGPMPRLETVGLWRLGTVAVLAYGLARWRLHDLPQRTARAAASAGGAAVAVVGGGAAYGATSVVGASGATPVMIGLLVLAAGVLPGVRLAQRLFDKARAKPAPERDDEMYGQRLDAYRAALEASLARGTLDEDAAFLGGLRERFGIDPSEHRVLLHYARSSVILGADGGSDGAFERLRLLGEGGAGRTWLARDRMHDRLVVLKEPLERWQRDPQLRETVVREARLTARVRHSNVIAIHEVVEHKGMPILVMEYAEGGSVADLLRRRGSLPWKEAVRLTLGVLRGVEAIHGAGIIHRDLKPSNLLLGADGTPKVADFGIAIPATSGKTIVEGGTTLAGTLSYMAPEVRAGSLGDRRSDVYACAAILHELVYGVPPGMPTATPPDVPLSLESVLSRALAPVADKRHATARALAEDLQPLVNA